MVDHKGEELVLMTDVESVRGRDFDNEDGTRDWKAYHEAEVANGDICYQCGEFDLGMIMHPKGHRTLCRKCKRLEHSDEDESHKHMVRCPHCRHIMHISERFDDYPIIYEEGEHEIDCDACEKHYTINVNVEYSYTSPAMIKEGEGEDQ
jgi:DNA-directed RNA polymerase subunit RPC12/RpoP